MDDPTAATNSNNPSGDPGMAEAAQAAGIRQARLRRVREYQVSSLAKVDPLEANLGSINSGLMEFAIRMEESSLRAIESSPPNAESLARLSPLIADYLGLTRQIDRYANLELRISEARKPKPESKPRSKPI